MSFPIQLVFSLSDYRHSQGSQQKLALPALKYQIVKKASYKEAGGKYEQPDNLDQVL